jgi:hypothetical protein
MEHTAIPEPAGFGDLPKAEQPAELPIPGSHLEIAEGRLEEYRRDPTRAGSAFDTLDRLAHRPR